jgi:hypothetical protein
MTRILILSGLMSLGCTISPVIDAPGNSGTNDLYDTCRRAAKDYCKYVIQAHDNDTKACVAKSTYECVTGKD